MTTFTLPRFETVEGRKILHLPEPAVSWPCVRVPVERSHSISANAITEERLDLDDVRRLSQVLKAVS